MTDGGGSISKSFGAHTFNLEQMRRRLPRPTFEAIEATIAAGDPLDMNHANEIAHAMKEWAIEHGATHFTHWFQPLTGATAEKHDAFLGLADDKAIERFSGGQLVQTEPDASSFPSGGIRSTFEARGYTAWDPTSPAFLIENEHGATLTIPSVFVSYTGEALDEKTPLLRSMRELSRAATETVRLLGRETRYVTSTLGAEQEYFLVDRDLYDQRPDLAVTGRTVLGSAPPKGQQLEDHYFGTIDERALDFMGEVELEAWKLGIPLTTRHNEVAPHQYEAVPIYRPLNLASDQNHMLMDIMRRVARRRGLAVLFHEKPFAGVNGSGKHNNWSLADADGRNFLSPGDTPEETVDFLYFLTAVVRGVHRRARLLRAAVASAGNDHRLGANEAPPAIISIFLGERVTEMLETLLGGEDLKDVSQQVVDTGLVILPDVRKDNTDRNRTSPFAFTGNKFEFRAVGASQSNAMPMAYLNIAVAEALDEMNPRLEARLHDGEARNDAVLAVVKTSYAEAKAIVFNGNNYDEAWLDEAKTRGLPNEVVTPDALKVLLDDDIHELFERYDILRSYELTARHTILLGKYNRMLDVEAVQLLRMAKTGVLPAAYQQQNLMASAIQGLKACGIVPTEQSKELTIYAGLIEESLAAIDGLRQVRRQAPDGEHTEDLATYCASTIIPAMGRLREVCDALERRTDSELWPFPTYYSLLFQ
ncbi:MAG: glutamine synthetase III [Deltaproteobacteria bacterium]|nr:glutamine synthetase III [Deltaproteobacteria bacterium]